MTTNKATAKWSGDLKTGNGKFELANGGFKGAYSFKSRFEGEAGTNPEELIAAAHAACFSMAFSNELATAGFTPNYVSATAAATLGKDDTGFAITDITLTVDADVPGITDAKFQELGEAAKKGCPVSKALAGVKNITLQATLQKAAA
jgi:osmotically inducible protein OsmC